MPFMLSKIHLWRPSAKVLAGLAFSGFKSKGSVHTKGRLLSTLQSKTPLVKVTGHSQSLFGSGQKQEPKRLLTGPDPKTGGRKGVGHFISGFLFLVPKPNNRWRPILDLSQLNLYLASASFKMETPETIRLSLQQGEWVTSLDFSDAYFHIPINPRSWKFLRFHLNNQSYQFTSLPFGLSTAPLEFTKVVKEVKLMAQARGIQIHQYLDDWLLRAPSHETCLRHTQTLLDLCRNLGWVVNRSKSELVPQQLFNFVGYRFDLSLGLVKPTQERWASLTLNLILGLSNSQPYFGTGDLLSQAVYVPQWSSYSDGKTGGVGTPAHEAYPVAFKEVLARPGISREGDSPPMSMSLSCPRSLHVHLARFPATF